MFKAPGKAILAKTATSCAAISGHHDRHLVVCTTNASAGQSSGRRQDLQRIGA
jgi:hypothetical protein